MTRNGDKNFGVPKSMPELKENEVIVWGGINDMYAGYMRIRDPYLILNEEEERFVEEETALLRAT